jgi:hypothetical protein
MPKEMDLVNHSYFHDGDVAEIGSINRNLVNNSNVRNHAKEKWDVLPLRKCNLVGI